MGRSGQEYRGQLPDFASSYSSAVTALEEGVHELLSSGWDELRRRRAHEMAIALCESAKVAGWKETGGILQALASLLELPLEEVLSIREAL